MYHARDSRDSSTQAGPMVITARDVPTIVASGGHSEEKKRLPDDLGQEASATGANPQQHQQSRQDDGEFASYIRYIRGGSDISTFRRLFWLLVVMGAISGLSIQIYRSTDKFISRETNTKLSFVNEDELDFPSVTICNTNMFRLGVLSDLWGGWMPAYCHGLVYVRNLFPAAGISSDNKGLDMHLDMNEMEGYPGDQSLVDWILNSAHPLESMIKMCQFNGEQCSADNFTTIVTNYGVCYTFNSAKNVEKITVKTPGQQQGLSLILNAEETDVVAAPRETVGFKMLVHPRGEIPNLLDYGIELQPGTHTPVRLDVTTMSTLPSPYGECGTKKLKYLPGEYTELKCFLECETDYMVKTCGCRSFYMPGRAEYCSADQLKCIRQELIIFAKNRSTLCTCPKACFETIYKPTTSQMLFPSYGAATTMDIRRDYELVAIAFGEAVHEKAQQEIGTMIDDVCAGIYLALLNYANSEGEMFHDLYPNTTTPLAEKLLDKVFGNIQFDLFLTFTKVVLYEVLMDFYPNWNPEYEPVELVEEYLKAAEKYMLYTGERYKDALTEAFESSGDYPGHPENFDDFIDTVYEEFNFGLGFYWGFEMIYNMTQDLVWTKGYDVAMNHDVIELTTQYMRNNFLHVDVFYGDLKVETIQEQPSYEVFQFICDLGGALGLFFGASILSFIETADLIWFTKRSKRATGGKENTKTTMTTLSK